MEVDTEGNLLKKDNSLSNNHIVRNSKKSENQEACFNYTDYKKLLDEIDKIREVEEGNEDDFTTEELYKKLKFEEGLSCYYTITAIITALIYYESKDYSIDTGLSVFCLAMVSIFNILFSISAFVRNYLNFKIRISTQELTQRESFIDSSNFKHMILEIIWALLGPNYGFRLVTFSTGVEWNLLEINYELNDIMLVIQMFRLYNIFRFMIVCTSYAGERAHRVGKMMGLKINTLFSIRCIFYSHPVKMLIVLFLVNIISLSYMIKILEGPVYYISKKAQDNFINYNRMENCLWNVLVTMTTVGYGDFYPLTNLGRLVIIICAFLGTTLISLMTLITGNKLSLSETERKIYDFAQRLESRKEKDDTFITYTLSNLKFRTKYNKLKKYVASNPSLLEESDKKYQGLKSELIEALYEKIEYKKRSKKSF